MGCSWNRILILFMTCYHLLGPPSHLWQEVNNRTTRIFIALHSLLQCLICGVPGNTGCHSDQEQTIPSTIDHYQQSWVTTSHSCKHILMGVTVEHPHTTDHTPVPGWSFILTTMVGSSGQWGRGRGHSGSQLLAHSGEVISGWRRLITGNLDGASGGH